MEPVSVVGLTASMVGCVKIIGTSINSLLALQTKYKQADLTVQLFLGQLSTLRAALNKICDWITASLVGVPRHEQLVSDLIISVEGCQVLLLILSDRIASLDRNGVDGDEVEPLSFRGKTRLLWAENESNQYLSHLNNQIIALNLLLTALQCQSVHDQNTLLLNDESRHVMHLVKDDTSSLLWLRDEDSCLSRQSIVSESSNLLDVSFPFDREVFNSKVYQVAIRSALSGKKGKAPQRQGPPLNDVIDVLGYTSLNETEDDAQNIPRKFMNRWPLNDAVDVVGYERSDETEGDAQTIRGKSVNPWSLNGSIGFVGYDCSNEFEDDAQTIGSKFVDPWPLDDPISNVIIIRQIVEVDIEHSTNPRVSWTASSVGGDRGDKTDLSTGLSKIRSLFDKVSLDRAVASSRHDSPKLPEKDVFQRQYPLYTGHASIMNKKAPVKSGVPSSSSMTIDGGHKSMSAKDVNSQYLPSSVVLQHLQASQVPTEAAHTGLNENRDCSKVLILGSSGAGKSTLLKSMTMCCKSSYSRVELERLKEVIYSNLIEDMLKIIGFMKTLDIGFDSGDNHHHSLTVRRATQLKREDVALAITALWDDPSVQECFRRSKNCQLNDSCGYFFENISRIFSPNYILTNQDILRVRVTTTGITKQDFIVGDFACSIYDVGGRRSERCKWIHYFQNTEAIIFPVDISGYDLSLYENDDVNRMDEDLTLFQSIVNSERFLKTTMILFFNRVDLLQRKLAISPIDKYFPDFSDDTLSLEAVKAYIATKFVSLIERPEINIQVCFADMTDAESLGKSAFGALERCGKLKGSAS